jgi:acyl-coenzyme A synthetase/AMP-(fatty) acid ligase
MHNWLKSEFKIQTDSKYISADEVIAAAHSCYKDTQKHKVFHFHGNSAFDCAVALVFMSLYPHTRVIITNTELEAFGVIPSNAQSGLYTSTSGTTGTRKLVHQDLGKLVSNISDASQVDAKWLLAYTAGTFASLQVILTAMCSGHELHDPNDRSITALHKYLDQDLITHISATPSFWRHILMLSPPTNNTLKAITLGGEICEQNLLTTLTQTYPDALIQHIYASNEAGASFSVKDGKEGFPLSWLQTAPNSTKISISDDNELLLQSNTQSNGYMDGGLSRNTMGWLKTGDIVSICGDRVIFEGRKNSVMKVAGEKVSTEKVENFILNSIKEITDVYVYGKKSPLTGYILIMDVCVSNSYSHEKIRKHINKACQKLAPFERPRIINFVKAIELEANGKKSRPIPP